MPVFLFMLLNLHPNHEPYDYGYLANGKSNN